ncbi:MAG: TldD/PmbA family protein [Planctomycetes bacterium]|nr:TldD/PmbA family protein [Planctomycetota bacterium]
MTLSLASEATFRRIADTVLSASKADHTSVNFNDSESSTLRFANDQVTQNVSVRTPNVTVRVAFGQKHGAASTNRLDKDSLTTVVRQAETIARLAPDDPEYLPPLDPQKYLDVPSFRKSTASAGPMDLAKLARPAIEQCTKNGFTAAGIVSNGYSSEGVAASSGLFGYEQSTESEFSLTATADDSSGWCNNSHRDIEALGISYGVGRAVDKAKMSKNPRELPAGHYPAILEPSAVAGVLGAMGFAFDAKSYYKGNSALAGKLGSQILDPRLSVRTDPRHPDLLGGAFDNSGLATRPMTWIEDGVLKQLSYDRFTAKEHNVEPTPFPRAMIVSLSGRNASSIDDLIANTKRAILITNFWYIRPVDQKDLTITGMTRDGTFLVEDGKITCGVKNFRFHDSPLRCFAMLPAVLLPDFHLSSVTKF